MLASVLSFSLFGAEAPPPVSPFLIRPGVNSTAAITPVGVTLVSYGYSSDGTQQYLTGLYEYGVWSHIAVLVIAPHFTSKDGNAGIGDTSVGVKVRMFEPKKYRPALSAYYAYKEPTGTNHNSTGFADHKAILYADQFIGKTRISANMATIWCGQKGGYRMQYLPSVGVIAPYYGRFGAAVQTYYSYSTTKYGGVLVTPTIHLTRNVVFFAGVDLKHTNAGLTKCYLSGITMIHRPKRHA